MYQNKGKVIASAHMKPFSVNKAFLSVLLIFQPEAFHNYNRATIPQAVL